MRLSVNREVRTSVGVAAVRTIPAFQTRTRGAGDQAMFIRGPSRTITSKRNLFTAILFAASWSPLDARAKNADGTGVAGDQFGASVATGDFDDDGFSDLVVGVPYDNSGVAGVNGGAINVMYGGGFTTSSLPENYYFEYTSPQFFHAGAARAIGLGVAVAVGDFDDDGYDDIVVGAPMDDIGAAADAGSVEVFYGSSTGPSTPDKRGARPPSASPAPRKRGIILDPLWRQATSIAMATVI
jgi:hypothetical protein